MSSIFRYLIFTFIILNFFSCAKTDEEEVRSAIREARHFLTSSECSNAKSVLDAVGAQTDNAEYVAVYSSSLACYAGYNDMTMAVANLQSIDTSDQSTGSGYITSFAAFNVTTETDSDQSSYTKVLEAIRYILEADSTTPDTAGRLEYYGTRAGNDLSMQAFMLSAVAFSKWFAYYGNADAAGVKGDGSDTDGGDCIFSYTQSDAVSYINTATPGGCTATGNEGHGDLYTPVSDETIKSRLCEGIYIFNNIYDILGNIEISSNSTLSSLTSAATLLTNVISWAESEESSSYNGEVAYQNSIAAVKVVTSISDCEALDINQIQKYYAILFESIF